MDADMAAMFPNGIRALLVDDDAKFLKSATATLAGLNFEGTTCILPRARHGSVSFSVRIICANMCCLTFCKYICLESFELWHTNYVFVSGKLDLVLDFGLILSISCGCFLTKKLFCPNLWVLSDSIVACVSLTCGCSSSRARSGDLQHCRVCPEVPHHRQAQRLRRRPRPRRQGRRLRLRLPRHRRGRPASPRHLLCVTTSSYMIHVY